MAQNRAINGISPLNTVITGASSGIGRALAVEFARHGHPVLATARREECIEELCEQMAQEGNPCVRCFPLDLTAPGAAKALLDEAVRVFGKVHVLINAAGMSPYQEFSELSCANVRRIIELNVLALTELCHLYLPHMQAHGEPGHIVNVGSVGAYAPLPRFSVYTGSKNYVRAFTDILAYECRGANIRVSALHPGGTLTEFPRLAGQQIKPFARKTMLTPERVAEIAYPAILKGQRVIVPGFANQLAVLLGKLLPFPWAIRLTDFVYRQSMDQVPPEYPS